MEYSVDYNINIFNPYLLSTELFHTYTGGENNEYQYNCLHTPVYPD